VETASGKNLSVLKEVLLGCETCVAHRRPRTWRAHYDLLENSTEFQKGDQIWLYLPTRTRTKSPKLQPPWECPHMVITRINIIVYRIRRHPMAEIMVVSLDKVRT
jgi:hypothetical protein